MLSLGHSHSRTFFSRTVTAVSHEDVTGGRTTKLDSPAVSATAISAENDMSDPSRNSLPAGNPPLVLNIRGGQSKRSAREGRGRSNWHQTNGYRKPASPSTAGRPPSTSAVQQSSDAVGKTQPNSDIESLPLASEIAGSLSTQRDPPLPQRNHQRQSFVKHQPHSTAVNSTPSVESADT